jgi:hypothetical protein
VTENWRKMQGLHNLISSRIRVMKLWSVKREVSMLQVEEFRHKTRILLEKKFGKVVWKT